MADSNKTLHIVMYPWFAFSHLTPFLHLSNKLAEKGHKISFLLPPKAKSELESFNLHPNLITFIPITLPHVDGLPPGSETTSDVPPALVHLLIAAMDLTQPTIEFHLNNLKPNFVFFDFVYWLPSLARKLNVKSIMYNIVSPAIIGYCLGPGRTENLVNPPPNFPPSSPIKLRADEARCLVANIANYGDGVSLSERISLSLSNCDAISFNTTSEMEGHYCNYVEKQFGKQVILAGPVVPEPSNNSVLDPKIETILSKFDKESVIYCAFGSEFVLDRHNFQELLLGLESTGLPFFAALKPPVILEKIELAFPDGFEERVKGRGSVYIGLVQQLQVLEHSSVGCFLTNCGSASISEAMVRKCQLVLLPQIREQLITARLMSEELKVGVEVETHGEEELWFSRNDICKAVKSVMDYDSEISKEVRKNHTKWREFLLSEGLEDSYIHGFVQKLNAMLL